MKKKMYFVQIGYAQNQSVFFPFAAGTLLSYVLCDEYIKDHYDFGDILFLRTDIDEALARFEKPDIVGFSCYVWNYEYNKALAKRVKELYPECIILFGGHHIPPHADTLDALPYVDYLLHGEGEETLRRLLTALDRGEDVSAVNNLSYRVAGKAVSTRFERYRLRYDASPYLDGSFDKLMQTHPELKFQMILETSRGCPYGCSYCDWGLLRQRMTLFSEEKIRAEIDWAQQKDIDFIALADANFGMLERDLRLSEYIVRRQRETGKKQMVQASYDKNINSYVFDISKLFDESGVIKGVTISFQSLNTEVLNNIGRSNISMESFRRLLERYNQSRIATYSELIMGLPGETYDSFIDGIEKLMDMGQHSCIYIHNCELLPCSAMAQPAYRQRFQIRTSRFCINHNHLDVAEKEKITEYSHIVTQTATMSFGDWLKLNLFSAVIQSFHYSGVLKLVAVYVHTVLKVPYTSFYGSLLEYLLSDSGELGECCRFIERKLAKAETETGELVFVSEDCPFTLSADEYLLVHLMRRFDGIWLTLAPFLARWDNSDEYRAVLAFQRFEVKRPYAAPASLHSEYDLKPWFDRFFGGEEPGEIIRVCAKYSVTPKHYSLVEYMKEIIWYGKKTVDKTYLSQTEKESAQ